eukprot:2649739-Rhodomonas_salina.3
MAYAPTRPGARGGRKLTRSKQVPGTTLLCLPRVPNMTLLYLPRVPSLARPYFACPGYSIVLLLLTFPT